MRKLVYITVGAIAGWWAWGKVKAVKEVQQVQMAASMQGAVSALVEALQSIGVEGTVDPGTVSGQPAIIVNVDDPMAVAGSLPPVINGLPVVII
jgi:hypothetical protein